MAITARNASEEFFKAINENGIVLVYDLETTGLSPRDNHPIQVSVRSCAITDEGLQEYAHSSWFINPGYPLPAKITELTGITDEFLSDKPSEDDVFDEIAECFGDHPICGYNNARFDDEFMKNMFARHGRTFKPSASMDLYPVTQRVLNPGVMENFKLATVTDYFGFTEQIEQFHNADGDTLATELVFGALMAYCRQAPDVSTLLKPDLVSVAYWRGSWGKMPRIYVDTTVNGGREAVFWIDPLTGTYYTKNRTDTAEKYDIGYLEKQVRDRIGCEYRDWHG